MMAKTRGEIDQLKRNWYVDPCWDIEDTEGFEDHREELATYAEEARLKWAEARGRRLANKAEAMGCSGNLKLAAYIQRLEDRISELEDL